MDAEKFESTGIFAYNHARKIMAGISYILLIVVAASFAMYYFFHLRNSDFAAVKMLERAVVHITSNIGGSTYLGVLYSGLIGGLFFIFMPLEIFFARFAASGHNLAAVILIQISGLIVAYTVNYLIGQKLSFLAKKLISPQNFYKTKGIINRYGSIAVFAFNATPMPSQPLAAILGVFRYNKTRFYVYFIAGQLVKMAAIIAGVRFVF